MWQKHVSSHSKIPKMLWRTFIYTLLQIINVSTYFLIFKAFVSSAKDARHLWLPPSTPPLHQSNATPRVSNLTAVLQWPGVGYSKGLSHSQWALLIGQIFGKKRRCVVVWETVICLRLGKSVRLAFGWRLGTEMYSLQLFYKLSIRVIDFRGVWVCWLYHTCKKRWYWYWSCSSVMNLLSNVSTWALLRLKFVSA